MALEAAARTHTGKVRATNEDAWICRPEAGLFAVVDGMGGEASGEVASAIAVRALAEVSGLPGVQSEAALGAALRSARDRILAEADADKEKEGMGAVASVLRFDDDGKSVTVAHVGDTRVYLIHAEGVRQLTKDHVADGPPGTKRQVARDLGRREVVGQWIDTVRSKVSVGDLLVICSDGLTDVVSSSDLLAEFVRLRGARGPADSVATRLVALALDAGGPDNITVVAIRVGRFARRAPVHLPVTALFSVGVALIVIGSFAFLLEGGLLDQFGRRTQRKIAPFRVEGTYELNEGGDLAVASAMRTVVRPESALRVVGQRITGNDWTIYAEPPSIIELQRTVIATEADVFVELGAGSEALIRDVRVERGRLRVMVPIGARARIEHVLLASEGGLVVEGPGAVFRTDVQVVKRANEPSP